MLCQLLLYSKVTQLYVYIYMYIYMYIYTHTYILFHILFHYGLSPDIEYNFLCYKVGPCCLLVAQLCLTLWIPWVVAHQIPMSMEFSRQESWNGLPFPHPEMEPKSPALLADPLLSETPGKPSPFYIYQFASASSKLPLLSSPSISLLAATSLFSMSVSLLLFCSYVRLCCILDSTCK